MSSRRLNAHYGVHGGFFGDSIRAAGLQLFVNIAHIMQPFIIWPIVVILAVVMNWQWHASPYVLAFIPVAAVCISTLIWILPPKGWDSTFWHAVVTTGALGALLFSIDLLGWSKFAIFMMITAVPLICLTWSIRIAKEGSAQTGLDHIFAQAGVPGARMTVHKADDDHEVPT